MKNEGNSPVESMDETARGSLERGVAGDYSLSVGDVIREAWDRVAGNKGTVWGAMAIYLAVTVAVSLLLGWVLGVEPTPPPTEGAAMTNSPMDQLRQWLTTLITIPLWIGTFFVGVAIASDKPAKPISVFAWYDKLLKLFLTYILMVLLIGIGFLLLVIPGIYLAVSYQLALPLVADKNLGPWEAMETSRKIVTCKWFSFFLLMLVFALAVSLSLVLFGIPLIWVVPACVIGIGIVYRNVIGAEPATLERVAGN